MPFRFCLESWFRFVVLDRTVCRQTNRAHKKPTVLAGWLAVLRNFHLRSWTGVRLIHSRLFRSFFVFYYYYFIFLLFFFVYISDFFTINLFFWAIFFFPSDIMFWSLWFQVKLLFLRRQYVQFTFKAVYCPLTVKFTSSSGLSPKLGFVTSHLSLM